MGVGPSLAGLGTATAVIADGGRRLPEAWVVDAGGRHQAAGVEGYYRTERGYGAFERTIPLPVEVDTDRVEATFKKGILTVRLPKTGGSESARQIPVRAG